MPTRRERAIIEQKRAQQEKKQKSLLVGGGVVAALVIVVVALAVSGFLSPPPPRPENTVTSAPEAVTCSVVQSFPTQTRDHIEPNQPHPAYSSNPPTSGWHWANPQEWGIYTTAQVQEQLVHNLEHGGIIIQYNNLPPDHVQRLTDLVKRDSHHMILAPYPDLPADVRVAMTAWNHLRTCTGVDEGIIQSFVNAFRDKGPELAP